VRARRDVKNREDATRKEGGRVVRENTQEEKGTSRSDVKEGEKGGERQKEGKDDEKRRKVRK
jgi:hypothetical protein